MRSIGLLLVLVIVLACACGCRPPKSEAAEPALATGGELPPRDSGLRCSRERRPGSHIKEEVCRSTKQGGADRDATERALRRPAAAEPMAD